MRLCNNVAHFQSRSSAQCWVKENPLEDEDDNSYVCMECIAGTLPPSAWPRKAEEMPPFQLGTRRVLADHHFFLF